MDKTEEKTRVTGRVAEISERPQVSKKGWFDLDALV